MATSRLQRALPTHARSFLHFAFNQRAYLRASEGPAPFVRAGRASVSRTVEVYMLLSYRTWKVKSLSLESCLSLAPGDLAPRCRGAGPGGPRVQPDSLHPPTPGPSSWEKVPSEGGLGGQPVSPVCGVRRGRAGVNVQRLHEGHSSREIKAQLPSPSSGPTLCHLGWLALGAGGRGDMTRALLAAQSGAQGPRGSSSAPRVTLALPDSVQASSSTLILSPCE